LNPAAICGLQPIHEPHCGYNYDIAEAYVTVKKDNVVPFRQIQA